jgi:hypothetical protein
MSGSRLFAHRCSQDTLLEPYHHLPLHMHQGILTSEVQYADAILVLVNLNATGPERGSARQQVS